MNRPDEPGPEEFGGAYWEDRYRSGVGASKHDPSPSLVAALGGLLPGTALDAGCGVGADALWLAAQGWRVTAADISAAALHQGRTAAEAAGPACAGRIEWVHADLTTWDPGERAFDLVSCQYVHVPGRPEHLFQRLASWVAPGGVLLVVGHHAGAGHEHAHPAGAQVYAEQVVSGLPEDQWDVIAAGPRTHTMHRPDGDPLTLADLVVHARRRAADVRRTAQSG